MQIPLSNIPSSHGHFCTSLYPSIMIRLTVNARLSAHTVRMLWHPLADALIAKWVGISSVSDRNSTKHIYFHCPVSRYVTEIRNQKPATYTQGEMRS